MAYSYANLDHELINKILKFCFLYYFMYYIKFCMDISALYYPTEIYSYKQL